MIAGLIIFGLLFGVPLLLMVVLALGGGVGNGYDPSPSDASPTAGNPTPLGSKGAVE